MGSIFISALSRKNGNVITGWTLSNSLKPLFAPIRIDTSNIFFCNPHDKGKYDRQDLFFSANKLNPKFKIALGKYLSKTKTCSKCGHIHRTFEEKETDVKIATNMISDVVNNVCDVSILVSADSDLIPPIEFIRNYKPSHKIFVYFPPQRFSSNLNNLANATKKLDGSAIAFGNSLLPDTITLASGFVIVKPPSWV